MVSMGSTYNEVTPVSLGKGRKNGKTRGRQRVNAASKESNDHISQIPMPPPFPPPHSPPLPPPPQRTPNFSGLLLSHGSGVNSSLPSGYTDSLASGALNLPLQEPSQSWNQNNIASQISPSSQGLSNLPGSYSDIWINQMAQQRDSSDKIPRENQFVGGGLMPTRTMTGTLLPGSNGLPHINPSDIWHHSSSYAGTRANGNNINSRSSWNDMIAQPSMNQRGMAPASVTLSNGKKKRKPSKSDNRSMAGFGVESINTKEEAERRRKRAERFGDSQKRASSTSLDDEENYANLNAISTKSHKFDKDKRIVGRCQTLEKSYLRLTSEPNPDLVRPLNVLKKAYTMLMRKYQKNQATYQYLCDQFKSMRQDLRVQMIENQFAVKVYESHARIALENGDIGEFNQCQSRLITLFELPNIKPSFLEEFTSYRILYYMLTEDNGSINTLRLKLMTENPAVFSNHLVQMAFKMAHSRLIGDYHHFMKAYSSMDNLGKKLVDAFIEKEKLKSLVIICKSYNQIKLDFLMSELQFKDKEEIIGFFKQRKLNKYIVTKNLGEDTEFQYLDTKACRLPIIQQYYNSKKIDIKGQQ